MEIIENAIEFAIRKGFLVILVLTILLGLPILSIGFYGIGKEVIHFYNGEATAEKLLFEFLHYLEFFFLAPLPTLIFFSFKDYVSPILNSFISISASNDVAEDDKISDADTSKAAHKLAGTHSALEDLNPEFAEKAFFSSLIGATSSYVLAKLVESFEDQCSLDSNRIMLFGGCFIFLGLQFFLLKTLSKEEH